MSAHLKILSLDVRGHKQDLILHELKKLSFDFIFLQETHVSCVTQARKLGAQMGRQNPLVIWHRLLCGRRHIMLPNFLWYNIPFCSGY